MWFVSLQLRIELGTDLEIGLAIFPAISSVPSFATYRPAVNFKAVLPLPNRSYATPSLGSMSFQLGASYTGSYFRWPSHGLTGGFWKYPSVSPGNPADWAGT